MILHTEAFTYAETAQMCKELNAKFGLRSKPFKRSGKYHVIYIPKRDEHI